MISETNNCLLNSLFSLTLSVSDNDTADFKRVITNVVRSGALREDGDTGVYRIETLTLLFELALYISSKDRNRAEATYSKVLQSSSLDLSTIAHEESDDDLPALVPIYSEPLGSVPLGSVPPEPVPPEPVPLESVPLGPVPLESVPLGPVPLGPVPLGPVSLGSVSLGSVSHETAPIGLVITEVEGTGQSSPLFDNITKKTVAEEQTQEADEEDEQEANEEDEQEADEEGQEAEEEEQEAEEEEQEQSEEEVELDLEPVRIKKIIYWRDVNSGDIYQCLPEDEVGDRVGRYVDGKPVFEPGL